MEQKDLFELVAPGVVFFLPDNAHIEKARHEPNPKDPNAPKQQKWVVRIIRDKNSKGFLRAATAQDAQEFLFLHQKSITGLVAHVDEESLGGWVKIQWSYKNPISKKKNISLIPISQSVE
ncbi:MAG TPA: hypothetical protein PLF15_03525 [bacterium]|nr:hypothetical protein [bacterium]